MVIFHSFLYYQGVLFMFSWDQRCGATLPPRRGSQLHVSNRSDFLCAEDRNFFCFVQTVGTLFPLVKHLWQFLGMNHFWTDPFCKVLQCFSIVHSGNGTHGLGTEFQRVGLREKYGKPPRFHGKSQGFRFRFCLPTKALIVVKHISPISGGVEMCTASILSTLELLRVLRAPGSISDGPGSRAVPRALNDSMHQVFAAATSHPLGQIQWRGCDGFLWRLEVHV